MNATPKIFANDVTYKPILRICKIVTSDARGLTSYHVPFCNLWYPRKGYIFHPPRRRAGWLAAEAFHSLFSHTDGKFGMGAVRMGAGGTEG
jgi:hypothetical protein